jgi:hypothetical protein
MNGIDFKKLGRVSFAPAAAAAEALQGLLNARSNAIRLAAARAVLQLGMKLRDTVDLETRLATVEEKLREKENNP